jgi:transposase
MAKPYSQDLRERLVKSVEAGHSRHEVARTFGVSPSCVIKLMQQWKTTGDCRPRKFGGHKRPALADHEAEVRALVEAEPDLTVTELWGAIRARGIKIGRSAVGRFLQHLELTYKKNSLRHRTAATGRSNRARRVASGAKKL